MLSTSTLEPRQHRIEPPNAGPRHVHPEHHGHRRRHQAADEPVIGAEPHHQHHPLATSPAGLTRLAFLATLHYLTGCAIGEVLGLVIGTALGWGNLATIALAVALTFAFGYAFTIVPLHRRGLPWRQAAHLALAADTVSILVMETVDNALMWVLPGTMDAALDSGLFWGAMTFSLGVALFVAWPINRWLMARGRGHALVHAVHGAH